MHDITTDGYIAITLWKITEGSRIIQTRPHKCVHVERISLTNKIPIAMTMIAVSTKAPKMMIPAKNQT